RRLLGWLAGRSSGGSISPRHERAIQAAAQNAPPAGPAGADDERDLVHDLGRALESAPPPA
ncbi:MAG TPA: hypothetical protein VD886_23735, partial [Herpetosiphonaceae bacterium]|nr:hypothetical protein [Herpetosiphonaceae bacterium]